jgi:predicted transcriptional regulator of viral defense system
MLSSPLMSSWLEQLQSRGRYTFTRSQAESETGRSFVAAQTALRRLKGQGRIISPRRGFYVVVPPEYRAVGSPPASWFIDDLMRYLGQPYYVGLLSAAAIHGAAHQQPMVFQVVTSKPTREMRAGRVAIRFWMSGKVDRMPVTEEQTETGTMRVATPETTAFDLVRYPAGAGHLSNAATVLAELAERMDARALVDVAPLVRVPDVQRLGYLVEAVGDSALAEPLAGWLRNQRPRAVLLRPREPVDTEADKRWHIIPNADLEIDL